MRAAVTAIEYYLPDPVLSSAQLAAEFPDWPVEKIEAKTGIRERRIAAEGQCSSDLAVCAAKKLFRSGVCSPGDIDYLLLCTQSPDYFLPPTACLVQERLGLPTSAGALDFNLGCSGFVYGLSLAKGLIETGQCRRVLLITAETYSKFLHPLDKSVRAIFGDAAAATLVEAVPGEDVLLGPFVFGTDGRGAGNLIVPAGGMRTPKTTETAVAAEAESGNWRAADNLFMDGPKIFEFTMRVIPDCVRRLLEKSGKTMEQIDRFVFHQANRFMLEHLRKKLGIASERFPLDLESCGNTVSSTIPITMKDERDHGRFPGAGLVMLVGFGVGYSWGAALMRWPEPAEVRP
jgi:3-oxoacyl-[acyl-carrier-protein] synthase III